MIDFEFEPQVRAQLKMYHAVAEGMMRPISREFDEHEHEKPWPFYEAMWSAAQNLGPGSTSESSSKSARTGSRLRWVGSTYCVRCLRFATFRR